MITMQDMATTPEAPLVLAAGADEADRARALAVMKRRATGLLVFFAGLFVVTRLLESRWPWLAIVRATSEAAMVGGLADWFAVTAIFRQPLGLPIPHTAIVPRRKDRIGRSLGNFVQRHFLTRDVLARQLHGLRVAERLSTWAAAPENAARIARQLASGLSRAAESIPGDDLQQKLHEALIARGKATQVSPVLGDVLSLVASDGRHQALLDAVLEMVEKMVDENRDAIRQRISDESPWWVPTAIDDKLYMRIVSGIERIISEARARPDHPIRLQFDHALFTFIEDLRASPEVIEKAEGMKERLLASPVVGDLSASLWESTRRALLRYADPDSPSPSPLERGVVTVAERIAANEQILLELDEAIAGAVVAIVERYRVEIASFIERTVAEWDAGDATRRIEVAVGRDLQFIRINGTLVGGLVGLLLHLISAALA
jgi:uncharacterized membrane-anchored protein YjiN (DUF445 family)